MSKRKLKCRAKLKKAKSNKEYLSIQYNITYPIYWDDGIQFRGGLMRFEQRSYKTWKHNRRTQYRYIN